MFELIRRYCLLPILLNRWGFPESSDLIINKMMEKSGENISIEDSCLSNIKGIEQARRYIKSSNPGMYEESLSEKERQKAYIRAQSIWLSRMEKQME